MEQLDALGAKWFARGDYEEALDIADSLTSERTVSHPLYQLERISSLLMQGRNDEAHQEMLRVREDIELLFDRGSEERAVSLWHGENNKVFKGDNHERAILYAFLSLSYLERGDMENALRCVKNGLLADSSSNPEASYSSDFGLLQYLGYFITMRAGDVDLAGEYRRELKESLKAQGWEVEDRNSLLFSALAGVEDSNAILVLWSGAPPTFARGGEYEEVRYVIPGYEPLSMITVECGLKSPITVPLGMGDVNFQAKTRGGREMDDVLANKALVKKGFAAGRNFLLGASVACFAACNGQSDGNVTLALACTGAACFTLGITFHIVGSCVNSRADERYWKYLPGNLTVIPLRLAEGENELTIKGYCGWDNLVTERCRGKVGHDGISVIHCSLMHRAKEALISPYAYLLECGESSLRQIKDDSNWMKYEVTE